MMTMPFASCRFLACCAAFTIVFSGCQQAATDNLISNPGFEDPLDGNGVPRGWAFSVASGEYKHETAESSQSGKLALVIAGSGGSAEVQTNAVPVLSGTVLECEAWLQTQLMKGGEPGVCVKFAHGDTTEQSALIRANGKTDDWQRVHFFTNVDKDGSAMLAVRLGGEGLIRIDDLLLRPVPNLEPAGLTSAKTFENMNDKGEFTEWGHVFRAKSGKFKQLQDNGHSRVLLEGDAGWSVLCTRRSITTKPSRIIFQAAVKVNKGKGQLKLDYIKKGNCFASSYSPEGSKDWTFVTVESDPTLVDQSDSVIATLAATCGAEYSVEFEAVDVFIAN